MLNPCKHCGSPLARVIDFAESAIHVSCKCGISLYGGKAHFGSAQEAEDAWNTPAPGLASKEAGMVVATQCIELVREAWRLMDGQNPLTSEWHFAASQFINNAVMPADPVWIDRVDLDRIANTVHKNDAATGYELLTYLNLKQYKGEQISVLNSKEVPHDSPGFSKGSVQKNESLAERENITLRRAVDMAQAGFGRWRNGHPFDSVAAGISDFLYDAIRPGAREGIAKLHSLISASQGSEQKDKG